MHDRAATDLERDAELIDALYARMRRVNELFGQMVMFCYRMEAESETYAGFWRDEAERWNKARGALVRGITKDITHVLGGTWRC